MARYIDADKTIELLKSLGSRDYRREKGTICDAIKMLQYPEYTPTADVAPKSEVEKLHEVIFKKEDLMQKIARERNQYSDEVDRLQQIIHSYALQYGTVTDQQAVIDKAKAEVATEIFEEIAEKLEGLFDFFRQDDCIRESSAIILAISEIAELKKKYTEVEE